ncbi:hypothetical protein EV421DRAFT_1735281 [Armillaria borealis]|uniref:Uncharacterized protein n=1 Tax=Armillaria borealis TaxID=47425 RepID=A0AA39JLN6_9AGAR|nr:hypothetical protein EV421DRAFT_1735281 [Armillaria borealis]
MYRHSQSAAVDRLTGNDFLMQTIVHLSSIDHDRIHPASTGQFFVGPKESRIIYPCMLVCKKWFDWAQPARLCELKFNRLADHKCLVAQYLFTTFADGFTAKRHPNWPVHIHRQEANAFFHLLINLKTVVFEGCITDSFSLFLVDLLSRHNLPDIRWHKDLDFLQDTTSIHRELHQLYPLFTGLSAYGLLDVDTIELSGPIYDIDADPYIMEPNTVHPVDVRLYHVPDMARLLHAYSIFEAIAALPAVEVLYLDLTALTMCVLKVRALKHLQELRLCVRASQLSYASAILEDLPHRGENVDVVAFSLKVYIRFSGITRIRGSPVLFDDVAEYLNTCLGTWNDVGRLTLFWDICESGIWKRAARPLWVAPGWRTYLKESIYTFN